METFIAQITMFGGNFAPRGWAFCDGQLLQISQHSALFSLLGTTYGGDGRTTFGLPDLRGRVPFHEGNGPGLPPVTLGQKAGVASTTLKVNNLPAHSHTATVGHSLTMNASAENGVEDEPAGKALGAKEIYSDQTASQAMKADLVTGTITVTNANTGNGVAFENRPPFMGVNFIIALQGTYPSRS